MNKRDVGKTGEELAKKFLVEKGFDVVKTNYYCPYGEIDLICKRDDILYFIEVKFRTNLKYGTPKAAINYKKISRMKSSCIHYLKHVQNEHVNFKLSFIGIFKDTDTTKIEFVENIFE